jgi:hypothetical protein
MHRQRRTPAQPDRDQRGQEPLVVADADHDAGATADAGVRKSFGQCGRGCGELAERAGRLVLDEDETVAGTLDSPPGEQ